jgi:hypothetical protein
VENSQEFCGEPRFPFGGVDTEAVNDIDRMMIVKAAGIFVANGGKGLSLFLDE